MMTLGIPKFTHKADRTTYKQFSEFGRSLKLACRGLLVERLMARQTQTTGKPLQGNDHVVRTRKRHPRLRIISIMGVQIQQPVNVHRLSIT
jgi:hypothetical protein